MEATYNIGSDVDVCRMFDQYLYKVMYDNRGAESHSGSAVAGLPVSFALCPEVCVAKLRPEIAGGHFRSWERDAIAETESTASGGGGGAKV